MHAEVILGPVHAHMLLPALRKETKKERLYSLVWHAN